jgi:hypothetical protein
MKKTLARSSEASLQKVVPATMLFVLIMLWTVTVVLLVADPKRPSIRWLSFVAFTGGAGALAAVLGDTVVPTLPDGSLARTLRIADRLLADAILRLAVYVSRLRHPL